MTTCLSAAVCLLITQVVFEATHPPASAAADAIEEEPFCVRGGASKKEFRLIWRKSQRFHTFQEAQYS